MRVRTHVRTHARTYARTHGPSPSPRPPPPLPRESLPPLPPPSLLYHFATVRGKLPPLGAEPLAEHTRDRKRSTKAPTAENHTRKGRNVSLSYQADDTRARRHTPRRRGWQIATEDKKEREREREREGGRKRERKRGTHARTAETEGKEGKKRSLSRSRDGRSSRAPPTMHTSTRNRSLLATDVTRPCQTSDPALPRPAAAAPDTKAVTWLARWPIARARARARHF